MANFISEAQIEKRFMDELRHHISGWHSKIEKDFGEENFYKQLSLLENDPVYSKFGFAIPEYVLTRLMGRFSISVGRRLGEIYDKVPRFLASARFELAPDEVAPLLDGLQLDICIPTTPLTNEDYNHVLSVFTDYFPKENIGNGIGIEIRYNFNPNDSSRLRKDEKMAFLLQDDGLFPVYLIFSEISPRDEAIARLQRAGWNFFVGENADDFMYNLIGMDFAKILDNPKIKNEIHNEINCLMNKMRNSVAFRMGARID